VSRTLQSTAGISITNPDGIAGDPVIAPSLKLADIQNLATTGILAVVGGTTVVDRNIVGTNQQITVVDGDGSGNPTISITPNPVLPGTGSVTVPTGTTAQRPGNLPGQIRFNSTLNVFEGQDNDGTWKTLALGGGVTSVGTGTGLTGGPITSTGTISIANTGVTAASYGDGTNVPQIVVNAQGQITSATNVAITASGIGAITAVNGTANEISSSQVGTVVTLGLPSAITLTGKTVTGGTLTGVSINGSTNTLTNIGNSSLVNSSLTVGTTNIALGGTSLTLGGLTSVTVTQDPTADLQLATKQYVDNVAQGLNVKTACLWGTTGNILLTGLTTQAGGEWTGTLTAGDRILVKNQLVAADNGIYAASATSWTRTTDANTWNELVSAFVFVEDGATLGDTGWVCTVNPGGTLGVTAVTWVQFSGAGTYSAGTGLTLTGTQFSITNTAVTAGSYGSASSVGTFTVNAQGQLTLAGSTAISIPASAINTAIPNSGLANSAITISLGGTISVGTVTSVDLTAGTGISVSGGPVTSSGSITVTNTAPDQTVVLNNGTGISVTGTYPNFTITNTSPSSGGTVTSVSGTGTVSGITLSGTVTTSGSLTLGGSLDLSSPPAIGGTTPNAITGTTITATTYVGISGGTF
jgi:hypothetical protein